MNKTMTVFLVIIMILSVCARAVNNGDINNDGEVNNKDVVKQFRHVSSEAVQTKADADDYDINGDGSVDNKDVTALFRSVSGKSMYEGSYPGYLSVTAG
ncbi:MAG: dockerin type I repeat-containing protein, partial [Clostridia bacterium]|nr:dockerin type I repeat-containing protein [Clostridia bacterium]